MDSAKKINISQQNILYINIGKNKIKIIRKNKE